MFARWLLSVCVALALGLAPLAAAWPGEATALAFEPAASHHGGCADPPDATVDCHQACVLCLAALPRAADLPAPTPDLRPFAQSPGSDAPDWRPSLDPPPPR